MLCRRTDASHEDGVHDGDEKRKINSDPEIFGAHHPR